MGNTYYSAVLYKINGEPGKRIHVMEYYKKEDVVNYVRDILEQYPSMRKKWFYDKDKSILIGEDIDVIISDSFMLKKDIIHLFNKYTPLFEKLYL